MTLSDLSQEEKECAVVVCALNDLVDRGVVRVDASVGTQITNKGIAAADQFRAEGIRPSITMIMSCVNHIYSPDPEELFWITLLVYLWLEDSEAVESICVRGEE